MSRKPLIEVMIDGSNEPYCTLEEIAKILNVHTDTLVNWAKRYPSLPKLVLPGGSLRVRASQLTKWIIQFGADRGE